MFVPSSELIFFFAFKNVVVSGIVYTCIKIGINIIAKMKTNS